MFHHVARSADDRLLFRTSVEGAALWLRLVATGGLADAREGWVRQVAKRPAP